MGKGQWQFEGGGFHESLPEGRSAGTLEVSPVSVKFVSDAGTVEMPVTVVKMGPATLPRNIEIGLLDTMNGSPGSQT